MHAPTVWVVLCIKWFCVISLSDSDFVVTPAHHFEQEKLLFWLIGTVPLLSPEEKNKRSKREKSICLQHSLAFTAFTVQS